jgi:hypothetical protein
MALAEKDLVNLGRRTAAELGMSGLTEQQALSYGKEVVYRLGKKQGVPNPEAFFGITKATPQRASHSRGGVSSQAPPSHHAVRFLGFEVTRSTAQPAKNRVQRRARLEEATTGRYRMQTRAVQAKGLKAGDRFLYSDVVVTVIEPAKDTHVDRFGRRMYYLKARRADTGAEGLFPFGEGGVVRKIVAGEGQSRSKLAVKDAAGAYCPTCDVHWDFYTNQALPWDWTKSRAMHERGTGHKTVLVPKEAEGRARTRYHSHPTHPYSHPVTTHHRRKR